MKVRLPVRALPLFCLVQLLPVCLALAQAASPASAEDGARNAILARLEAIQNLSSEFDYIEEFHPRHPNASVSANGITVITKTDPEESLQKFSFLLGRARWEFVLAPRTLERVKSRAIARDISFTATYQEGRLEFLEQRLEDKRPLGFIGTVAPLSTFEVGLGLRVAFNDKASWLTPDRISRMSVSFDRSSRPTLSEVQPSGKVYSWTFAPDHGYALVSYTVEAPAATEDPEPKAEIDADDFRLVSGVPMPFLIVHRWLRGDGSEMSRRTARVLSYALNDPANVADRYRIEWPKGIDVEDRRTGSHVTTTKDRQILDDKTYGELLEAQENSHENELRNWPPPARGAATQPG